MMSIIIIIGVAVLMETAYWMLSDYTDMSELVSINSTVVIVSLTVGGINYFAPKLMQWQIVEWAFLLIMIGLFLHLMWWWWWRHEDEPKDALPFVGLVAIFSFVTAVVARTIEANTFWASFITTIPALMGFLAIGFFAIAFCHYLHDEEGKGRWRITGRILTGITVLVVLILLGKSVAWGEIFTPSAQSGNLWNTSGVEDEFAQEPINHEQNREDSDFSAKLDEAEEAGYSRADASRSEILKDCRKNAEFLAKEATRLELWDDPKDYQVLLTDDGTSLSEEGKKLYYKVEGLYESAERVREDAPQDGYNSGYNDGVGYVVSSTAGITGNRSATKFTFKNGLVIWKMDRCGNSVSKTPPSKKTPPGETDEPPKKLVPPVNVKNPNKGPKEDTKNNKGKGPGTVPNPPTNGTNNQKNSEEYDESTRRMKDTQQNQKTGSDSNNPSTPPPSNNTKVDNNGARDNTNQKPSYDKPADGSPLTNGNDGKWSGPAD